MCDIIGALCVASLVHCLWCHWCTVCGIHASLCVASLVTVCGILAALCVVDIKGSAVARVESYKYVVIVLNNKLSWGDHVDFIVKKLNSRMYCLRKLNSFHI